LRTAHVTSLAGWRSRRHAAGRPNTATLRRRAEKGTCLHSAWLQPLRSKCGGVVMRVTKTKLLRVIAAEERRQKRDERREKRRLQKGCAVEPLLADADGPAPPRTGLSSNGPSTPASHQESGPSHASPR
jgi:hypothetical protein